MRPVRLITRAAQEIGRTDLSRRFHLTSHDELGELAGTFNEMFNHLEESKGGGELWIEDNGPGIAEEHQSHLFERFYRVDVARSTLQRDEEATREAMTSGRGLGLAIVQWVAQVHQGEIRLRSTVGHGSCLEIWLPLLGDSEW